MRAFTGDSVPEIPADLVYVSSAMVPQRACAKADTFRHVDASLITFNIGYNGVLYAISYVSKLRESKARASTLESDASSRKASDAGAQDQIVPVAFWKALENAH